MKSYLDYNWKTIYVSKKVLWSVRMALFTELNTFLSSKASGIVHFTIQTHGVTVDSMNIYESCPACANCARTQITSSCYKKRNKKVPPFSTKSLLLYSKTSPQENVLGCNTVQHTRSSDITIMLCMCWLVRSIWNGFYVRTIILSFLCPCQHDNVQTSGTWHAIVRLLMKN